MKWVPRYVVYMNYRYINSFGRYREAAELADRLRRLHSEWLITIENEGYYQ